jgi:hypothetical protein
MKAATAMGTTAALNLTASKIYRQKAESGNGFTETFHPTRPSFMILAQIVRNLTLRSLFLHKR